jgi:elongation factor G-like protein
MVRRRQVEWFEHLVWIDSDIAFLPDSVDRLRGHGLPIVGGIYAKKIEKKFASHFLPDQEQVIFGEKGGLIERGVILGIEARAGFSVISTEVPLPEMLGYSNDLRSLTQANGSFSIWSSASIRNSRAGSRKRSSRRPSSRPRPPPKPEHELQEKKRESTKKSRQQAEVKSECSVENRRAPGHAPGVFS